MAEELPGRKRDSERPEGSPKKRRVPAYMTLSEAAKRLNISLATMHNWWDWGNIPEDWTTAKNGQQCKAVSRRTYKELRRKYPPVRTEITAPAYDRTRNAEGRLKRGGEPGKYLPRSKAGWARYDENLHSDDEWAHALDREVLLRHFGEEVKDQFVRAEGEEFMEFVEHAMHFTKIQVEQYRRGYLTEAEAERFRKSGLIELYEEHKDEWLS